MTSGYQAAAAGARDVIDHNLSLYLSSFNHNSPPGRTSGRVDWKWRTWKM